MRFKKFLNEENGWIPFDKAIEKDKKKKFRKFWHDLTISFDSFTLNNYFYFPKNYNFNSNNIYLIKVSLFAQDSLKKSKIKEMRGLKKKGDAADLTYDEATIRIYVTGGNRGSGVLKYFGDKTKNPTNDQQELATIYAIMNPKSNIEEIDSAIGFNFDPTWRNHFEAIKEIRNFKIKGKPFIKSSSKIEHDATSDFASKLKRLLKKFGYSDSKDNWNPSDFWVLNENGNSILKYLEDSINLQEFNDKIKELFYEAKLVGISLKKIPSKLKVDIVDPQIRKETNPKNFQLDKINYEEGQTNAILKSKGGFNVRFGFKSSSDSRSVYFEGRMENSKVQLGAISKIQVKKYLKNLESIEKDKSLTRNELLTKIVNTVEESMKSDKDLLREFYYLAMKQSKDSSIYLKAH